MRAALNPLQIKSKDQQIYFNPSQQHSRISAGKKLASRHMGEKNQSYYLKSNPTEPISKQHGHKRGQNSGL